MKKGPTQKRNENILKTVFSSDVATFHFAASNKGSYNSSLYSMPWIFDGLMRKGKGDVYSPDIPRKFSRLHNLPPIFVVFVVDSILMVFIVANYFVVS